MDAAFPLEGLITEFGGLLDARDFEGAEELMSSALSSAAPDYRALLHYQMGRLYRRWNKLTSAINHFSLAAELAHAAGERIFLIQVMDELRGCRDEQARQRP